MIRLGIAREPRWVDVGEGVSLLLRPATTALVNAANLRSRRHVQDLLRQAREAAETGMPFAGPDLSDEAARIAYGFAHNVLTLAQELVADWQGIGDAEGNPLPFAREGLVELMQYPLIAERFFTEATRQVTALAAEGNA